MKADNKFLFSIILIIFLPNILFVSLNTNSLSIGYLIACILIISINPKNALKIKTTSLNLFLLSIFILYILPSSFFSYYQYANEKPILSAIIILIGYIAANSLSNHIKNKSFEQIEKSIELALIILLILGIIKLFYTPDFLNYNKLLKPVFPFSEESHYALITGSLLTTYCLIGKTRRGIYYLSISTILSVLFPSLLLIAFSFLSIASLTSRSSKLYFKIFIIIASVIGSLILINLLINNEYFLSRLSFQNSNNITTLVYLQGWQLIFLNFLQNFGFGLGFQNLGEENTIIGNYSHLISIFAKDGVQLNIYDGGFLAAKIISEFGLLGLVLILSFAISNLKFFIFQNKNSKSSKIKKNHFIGLCLLFSLTPEVFLRGYGYFSPTIFIAIAFLLTKNETKN